MGESQVYWKNNSRARHLRNFKHMPFKTKKKKKQKESKKAFSKRSISKA